MGPIERELRAVAEVCNGGTGVNGTPYVPLAGIAAWALSAVAAGFFRECACRFGENGVDAWSEAIEAAEALGL